MHSLMRIPHCISLLSLLMFTQVSCADNSDPASLMSEWANCKQEFLNEINDSLDTVLSQLDNLEIQARSNGDLAKLNAVKETHAVFVEKGTVPPSIDRTEFDRVRKKASAAFSLASKELVVKALRSKEDKIAELIDKEAKLLLVPLVADVQARWTAAVSSYWKEVEEAKVVIVAQLKIRESKARADGDPTVVNAMKEATQSFQATGIVPDMVSTAQYDKLRKDSREKLKQTNKSLVRLLLMNGQDELASTIADSLEAALVGERSENGEVTQARLDRRKEWVNTSYKTVFRHVGGKRWKEYESSGKLVRDLNETGRTDDYVEVFLLDRKQTFRLYERRADMLKDGRWEWVSNGNWSNN